MTDLLSLQRNAGTHPATFETGTCAPRSAPSPPGLLAAGAVGAAFANEPAWPGLHLWWLIRTLDPAYTTTDVGENGVDAVWFGRDLDAVGYFVLPTPVGPPSLAEIVRDLRERLDLPFADLAAMCGVRRRQLYNLLSGETTSTSREESIRTLHDFVVQLDGILAGNREQLRAAVLLPAGGRGESLYAAAISQDMAALHEVGRDVVERLRAGDVRGLIRRPSPRLARFGSARGAQDFLTEYRDGGEDDH